MRKSLIVAAVLGIAASGAFAQRAGADYDDWRPGAGATSTQARAEVQAKLSREQLNNPNLNDSTLWNPQASANALPVSRAAVREEVRQALANGQVLPVERNEATEYRDQGGVATTRFAGRTSR